MQLRMRRKILLIAAFVTLSIPLVVYAATIIFIQTFPTVPSTNVLATSGTCIPANTLVAETSGPVVGSSGTILFDCGTVPTAFTSNGGTATPAFTLPAAFSALYAVPTSTTSGGGTSTGICSTTATGAIQLTNGSPATIPIGSYVYCAAYTNWPFGGTGSAFTVTWSEA